MKKNLVAKIYEDNDIVICDSWKSINAVPEKVNKIIVFAHGQEYLATKKTKLIKKSLYRANHIISSSNYTLDLINNLNITEIKKSVIPPTYSLKATDENNIFKKPTKKVSILSITRLEERKGIIPVLKSLGYLHKEKLIKPFIWKICGEGNQETEIKDYIDLVYAHNELITQAGKSLEKIAIRLSPGPRHDKEANATSVVNDFSVASSQTKRILYYLEQTIKTIEFNAMLMGRMLQERQALSKINNTMINEGMNVNYNRSVQSPNIKHL